MSRQINLFNPAFRKLKNYLSATAMGQALGLILLGSVALGGYLAYQSRLLKDEAAAAAAGLAAAQTQLAQIDSAALSRTKNKGIEDGVKRAEGEIRLLQGVFDTLQKGEIGSTKGYAEYFRAFARQIVPGLWLTGLTIHGTGSEIGLQGRSLQPQLVPEYLGRLKHEEVLKGMSFATLEMQMPGMEQTAGSGETAGKRQAPPNYIEFSIRSADLPKDRADGTRGAGK